MSARRPKTAAAATASVRVSHERDSLVTLVALPDGGAFVEIGTPMNARGAFLNAKELDRLASAVQRIIVHQRRKASRGAARPSPRGTGTEAVERVCPACGETPSAARERWAKIAARPDFDPEGAPTPCDHAALRRGTGTEGGK